ncbi:MAG: hypothetical protein M3437_03730, partial [Chloroflexota bacterium]|nr:hypothetical protein [Chloroflexota bacterium]
VILSAAKNLVPQHMVSPFLEPQCPKRKGNTFVKDEILRCAQNDKVGAWFHKFGIALLCW